MIELPFITTTVEALPLEQIKALPTWSQQVVGLPADILRSALFSITGKDVYIQDRVLAAAGDVEIKYSGPVLDQGDLDLWMACIQLSRAGLGNLVYFTGRQLLKLADRSVSGEGQRALIRTLDRLTKGAVEIRHGSRVFVGHLIDAYYRDEATGKHVVRLSPDLARLYDNYTLIQLSERKSINGQPLAQWLHCFYSTHKQPFDIRVDTLHALCGSANPDMAGFRRQLESALERLAHVTGWECLIDEKTDLVTVNRNPTRETKRASLEQHADLTKMFALRALNDSLPTLSKVVQHGKGFAADRVRLQVATVVGTKREARVCRDLELSLRTKALGEVADELCKHFTPPPKGVLSAFQVAREALCQV